MCNRGNPRSSGTDWRLLGEGGDVDSGSSVAPENKLNQCGGGGVGGGGAVGKP